MTIGQTKLTEGQVHERSYKFNKSLPRLGIRFAGQAQRFLDISHDLIWRSQGAVGGDNFFRYRVERARSKAGSQALLISQVTEHRTGSLKVLDYPDSISVETIGHAEQIERFSHALGVLDALDALVDPSVLLRFKQAQRFQVRFKPLLNVPDIRQPVS